MSKRPAQVMNIVSPALHFVPERIIPELLNRGGGDDRRLNAYPDHPLRILQSWIQESRPNSGEAVRRRGILLDSTIKWLAQVGPSDVGLRALAMSIDPSFERTDTDPGSGMSIQIISGLLSSNEVSQLLERWPELLATITGVSFTNWEPLINVLWHWASPGHHIAWPIDPIIINQMKRFGRRMIRDLEPMALRNVGLAYHLRKLAKVLRVRIAAQTSPTDFEVLYPDREPLVNRDRVEKRQLAAARQLGRDWSQLVPTWVASRIQYIESEARSGKITWPRWTLSCINELARTVTGPTIWIDAFMSAGLSAELLEPLVRQLVRDRVPNWQDTLGTVLDNPNTCPAGVVAALSIDGIPARVIGKAVRAASGMANIIETMCLRGEVTEPALRALLRCSDDAVAGSAAIGMWIDSHGANLPSALRTEWLEAILRAPTDEYWVQEIIKQDSVIARRWIETRLQNQTDQVYFATEADRLAIESFDRESRVALLDLMPKNIIGADFITTLVNGDAEVYRALLAKQNLKRLHLQPLPSANDVVWPILATRALDAGYSVEDVADTSYLGLRTWEGPQSDMWHHIINRFDQFLTHEDPRLRLIAARITEIASSIRDDTRKRERQEAVYGRD